MSDEEMKEKVKNVLDEKVNPAIAAHGGHVAIVEYKNSTAFVQFSGGCQGCASSFQTLKVGVEGMLKNEIPEIQEIVDVTDHAAGENPFYS